MRMIAWCVIASYFVRKFCLWMFPWSPNASIPEGASEAITRSHSLLLSRGKTWSVGVHVASNTHSYVLVGIRVLLFWLIIYASVKAWKWVKANQSPKEGIES